MRKKFLASLHRFNLIFLIPYSQHNEARKEKKISIPWAVVYVCIWETFTLPTFYCLIEKLFFCAYESSLWTFNIAIKSRLGNWLLCFGDECCFYVFVIFKGKICLNLFDQFRAIKKLNLRPRKKNSL